MTKDRKMLDQIQKFIKKTETEVIRFRLKKILFSIHTQKFSAGIIGNGMYKPRFHDYSSSQLKRYVEVIHTS